MNKDFEYYTELKEDDEGVVRGFDKTGLDSGVDDDSLDYDDSELSLGFIKYVGSELDGYNQYQFIFTIHPDEFWGENFNYKPAGLCNDIMPDDKYIQKVVTIKTLINLDLIQDSGCFSMQDCLDGIVSLGWENLDGYEEFPEEGRIYFMFGEKYPEVEGKLAIKHILI